MRSLPKAKPFYAVFLTTLICIGVAACGSANAPATSSSPHGGYLISDGDRDNDDREHPIKGFEKTDTLAPLSYGKEADSTERRDVTSVVKRYYAAAAADNGIQACSLLAPTLAQGLGESEGQTAHGTANNCPATVSLLFKQQHQQLAADEVATMTVIDVRVSGDVGVATVGFRAALSGRIHVKREDGAWKVNALLDTGSS